MKDFQTSTPHKELLNRRSKEFPSRSITDQARKPQKIAKECLDSALSSVCKDAELGSASSITGGLEKSEVSEVDQEKDFGGRPKLKSPPLSAAPAASVTTDLSPVSVITTSTDNDLRVSVGDGVSSELNSLRNGLAEVEMVAGHLKRAREQMLNSTSIDLKSKKLLEALIEVSVSEFYTLPEEREWMDDLVSFKTRVLICFFLCLVISSAILLLASGRGHDSYSRPPPT